jgi:hypothetical protein
VPTLHIEHPISDLPTWLRAFEGFADARRGAGVVRERISRPVDDPQVIVIDLEFDTVQQASAFLEFLRTRVWISRQHSPALAGEPRTQILDSLDTLHAS